MKSQLLCIPVLLGLIQFTGAQYRPYQSAQEYGANPYPYDQNSDQLGQYGYVKNVLGKIGYPKGSGVYGRLTGEGQGQPCDPSTYSSCYGQMLECTCKKCSKYGCSYFCC